MKRAGLRRVFEPDAAQLGPDAEAMLEWLGGPAVIRVHGRDRTRCRLVVTLLHGNELSGTQAIHAWLVAHERPAVDAVFLFASVTTALQPPRFQHRMIPGMRDLNRCFFGPFDDGPGLIAEAILAEIAATGPECVVDIHNNTGHNPPYVIGTDVTPERLGLAALFAQRYIHSDLRLGSLMEAVTAVPCVTFECGRAGDARPASAARVGIDRLLAADRVTRLAREAGNVEIFESIVRVRARDGVRLAVSDAPMRGVELTMAREIDRHNFQRVEAGTVLGWATPAPMWPIEALDGQGRDLVRDLFRVDADGAVRARRAWIPIMMTTDPVIARQDCLFYIVDREPTGA